MFQTPVFPVISPSRLPFSQCFTYQAPVFPGSCLIWVATLNQLLHSVAVWQSSPTGLPSSSYPPWLSLPTISCLPRTQHRTYLPAPMIYYFYFHYIILSILYPILHCKSHITAHVVFTTLQIIHYRPCSLCHTTDHTNLAHVVFPNYPLNPP